MDWKRINRLLRVEGRPNETDEAPRLVNGNLRLLRDQKWPIPANIEYEYKGVDTVEEVRKCLDYCKRQLDSWEQRRSSQP